jgi:hypothetical protein
VSGGNVPFSVTISEVPDPDLGPLLTHRAAAGWRDPVVAPLSPLAGHGEGLAELPAGWRRVRSLEGQRYRWPTYVEDYQRYVVYETNTSREGLAQIALGEAARANAWGRERDYVVAFLSGGAPQVPLVEFLEADPEGSGEMVSTIRGFGGAGSRKMFGPSDTLPTPYPESFRIESYRDRIQAPKAWNKLCVVAAVGDQEAMLNHALLQARRRGDL